MYTSYHDICKDRTDFLENPTLPLEENDKKKKHLKSVCCLKANFKTQAKMNCICGASVWANFGARCTRCCHRCQLPVNSCIGKWSSYLTRSQLHATCKIAYGRLQLAGIAGNLLLMRVFTFRFLLGYFIFKKETKQNLIVSHHISYFNYLLLLSFAFCNYKDK